MAAKNPPPEDLTALYMSKACEAAEHAWQHARYLVEQAYRRLPPAGSDEAARTEEARRFADQMQNHADAGVAAFRAAKRLANEAHVRHADNPNPGV